MLRNNEIDTQAASSSQEDIGNTPETRSTSIIASVDDDNAAAIVGGKFSQTSDTAAVPTGTIHSNEIAIPTVVTSAAVSSSLTHQLLFPSDPGTVSSKFTRVNFTTAGKSKTAKPSPPGQELEPPVSKETDEALLIRRRAMNTIHSRRKRERQRIEIEVLKEQCAEFTMKNTAIQQENEQLESIIQCLQSRKTQPGEATTTDRKSVV